MLISEYEKVLLAKYENMSVTEVLESTTTAAGKSASASSMVMVTPLAMPSEIMVDASIDMGCAPGAVRAPGAGNQPGSQRVRQTRRTVARRDTRSVRGFGHGSARSAGPANTSRMGRQVQVQGVGPGSGRGHRFESRYGRCAPSASAPSRSALDDALDLRVLGGLG